MSSMAEQQRRFMQAGNQTTNAYNIEQIYLYKSLISEEVNEFNTAFNSEDNSEILKEATDVLVVTLGLIISMGVNPQDVWDLVHANNMAKVSDNVVKDETGKIMKSPESKARKEKMMENIKCLLK